MRHHFAICAALCALMLSTPAAAANEQVDALMLRFPDVSSTHIVFTYANDIWLAERGGGTAIPLASPSGREVFPRFSPDGQSIAFSANYDGSLDVYSLPLSGGVPQRLTYEPGSELVQEWTPDGRIVFSAASAFQPSFGAGLFYANNGGIPTPLPLVFADSASFSADGQRIAFTPWNAENRTWNRYQGGLAPDIWIYDLSQGSAQRITDFPGTDACPMFFADRVYYLSDAGPEQRRNIWFYDTASGQREQVTHFDKFETKYPSSGPDAIVLENGGKLYLLSVPGHELSEVRIHLPGDRKALRPQTVDASTVLRGVSLSPNAKRVAVEARGDIWTLPAEAGFPQNLTRSCDQADRNPAWSPDGKWIAYFSDQSGEYELYVRAADGSGEPRQLTAGSAQFYLNPAWSPDSKRLAFTSKAAELLLCEVESGKLTVVEKDPWVNPSPVSWSPDSNWIAWAPADSKTANQFIRLYNVKEGKSHDVTSPSFDSHRPVFDLSGDYLYFLTARNYNLRFSEYDDGATFLFVDAVYPAVLPLRKDVKSPFAPKNDAEESKDDEESAKDKDEDEARDAKNGGEDSEQDGKGGKDKQEPAKETRIDLDGLEARALALPVARSRYPQLAAGNGMLFYTRETAEGWNLYRFELKAEKEELVLGDVGGFILSSDASKALANTRGQWFVIDATPGAKAEKAVSTAGMLAEIEPRAEWRQLIRDVYRIYRDYFYDPGMHGVDWAAARDRALGMVEHAATREDVTYIISEMVSELNAGHTYVFGGASENVPNSSIGVLGCDFELANDSSGKTGLRFKKIYRGADWDLDFHGPLSQPGNSVSEGEFLLAINGVPLRPERSPYELLAGKAGATVQLSVGPGATRDAQTRDVLVQPLGWDGELRLRSWVEDNRRKIDQLSGGRVGYIYVRNTGGEGLTDLVRQFNGQFMKDALIIDERWNGGGMIPDRFIELLDRPIRSYWARRDGNSWRTPHRSHAGPKVMLINGHAGSGGDAFPYFFRQAGLGKLVGTRTWGGLIGISGNPGLIDGSGITVPTFGIFEADGTWGIEGYGVDPDYEVVNDPAALARGEDPQLSKALEVILAELEANPYQPPVKPAYPNRSGSGIPAEER